MKSDIRQVLTELCGLNEKSGVLVPSGGMRGGEGWKRGEALACDGEAHLPQI